MKNQELRNLKTLDPAGFEVLVRRQGLLHAACYRIADGNAVMILASAATPADFWPVTVPFHYYTLAQGEPAPLGWQRTHADPVLRNHWPKGAILYFPDQETQEPSLVFAGLPVPGRRFQGGDLSGVLEAAASRIRSWIGEQKSRTVLAEDAVQETMRSISTDITALVDHEMRTPLASVTGYVSLLRDLGPGVNPDSWSEYLGIIETESLRALRAVEKFTVAMGEASGRLKADEYEVFDLHQELESLIAEVAAGAEDILGRPGRLDPPRLIKAADVPLWVGGSRRLLRWAVYELVKNAVVHAGGGQVSVHIYVSGEHVVVDIEDDGAGVTPGTEELIFQRFYQDPATRQMRRGRRGLGLGLFLARQIAQRHLGQLFYVRMKNSGAFRLLLPRTEGGSKSGGFRQGA